MGTDRWDWFGRATPAPPSQPTDGASDRSATAALPFNARHEAPDGRHFTVTQPVQVTPRAYAVRDSEFSAFVAFGVSVFNASAHPCETTDLSFSVTTGGRPSGELLDGDRFGQPPAALVPGATLIFSLAYGFEPGQLFEVTVTSRNAGPVVTHAGRVDVRAASTG